MKHFMAALILCGAIFAAQAQTVQDVPTAVVWFYLVVEGNMQLPMELDNETLNAITMQKDNADARELMEISFEIIKNKIDSLTGVTILPYNELEGKTNYSRLGFPLSNLKKAAKGSDYQQYVKLNMVVRGYMGGSRTQGVTAGDGTTAMGVEGGKVSSTQERVYPMVDIEVNFGDKEGKSIEKFKGRYIHEDKIEITSTNLSKQGWSVSLDRDADPIPFYYFLEKAAEDLAAQINGQR